VGEGSADWVAEEELILRLLAGFHVDENGRQVTSYLTADSPEEKRARALLAQQLRAGTLSFIAREMLALAIDQDATSEYVEPTRKLVFKSRKQGPPSDWARNQIIAQFIMMELQRNNGHIKIEPAIRAAEIKFGLSRSQVMEIWTQRTNRYFD
jgi:hypothetical protein